MKIIWSPLAIDRVMEIASYIAKDDSLASEKWVYSLFKKVKRLEKFPDSGRVVPETKRTDIREIVFGNYRIIYRIEEAKVSILTVRHGKQILPNDDIK
ncbi:plasmid stabilization protein [bacterium SM23_31]|nr:MAG: plasmid stabilization protein [bacterium SM23_31]